MATKTYRALRKGYIDGRLIKEGEVFQYEFKEVAREDPSPAALKRWEANGGARPVGAIKRDKNGDAVMVPAKNPPSWAELVGKQSEVEKMVADVRDDNTSQDPNFDAMDDAALQAYAAERHIQFTKKTSRDDLITAIKAAPDATR
jgi:hypothetical protein